MGKNARFEVKLIFMVMMFIVLIGCGDNESQSNVSTPNTGGTETKAPAPDPVPETKEPEVPAVSFDPVELSVWFSTAKPDDAAFNEIFVQPVKKKQPNISMKMVTGKLEDMITAQDVPDLIYTHTGHLYAIKDLELLTDLTPFVKKYNVNLGEIEPVVIQMLDKTVPGQMTSFPYMVNFNALFYNIDLFDKFGVDYPPDGMNWDQAIDLGRLMTRLENGQQYRGLMVYSVASLQRQLGNAFYDPGSMRATLDTPEWKSLIDIFMRIYSITGNELVPPISTTGGLNEFTKDRNVAMLGRTNLITNSLKGPSEEGLNWDIAQYPSNPARPNIMTDVDAHVMLISSTSKHKEAAFQVLNSIVSDEVQMLISKKYARVSILKGSKYQKSFAAEVSYAQGKRISSIFKSSLGTSPFRDAIAGQGGGLIEKAFIEIYLNESDVNTALRRANEALDNYIVEIQK